MRRESIVIGIFVILLSSWAEGQMAQAPQPGPAPGLLVDIWAHKMFIRCVGPVGGGPTVILEAGGGGSSNAWSRVQGLLSPHVRSCAYDRAGLGRSEPGPAPRTTRQEAFELHALLEAAKIPGPFVLVGHSIGGLLVRLYAEQYGSSVVGFVLVDPTHESDVLGSVRCGGWVRLREKATAVLGTAITLEFFPGAPGRPQEVRVTGAGPKPRVSQKLASFAPASAELREFEGESTL